MIENEGTNPPIVDYRTPENLKTSGWAVASLVFGLLCWIPVIPFFLALYCGNRSLRESETKGYGGGLMAKAGMCLGVVGWIWTCLLTLAIPIWAGRMMGSCSSCDNNLRQIGTAILQYAQEHNNQFPPNLDVIMQTQGLTPKLFTCPSSGKDIPMDPGNLPLSDPSLTLKGHLSYIYLRPGKSLDKIDPKTVLIYEPLANHSNEGMYVLLGDMKVHFVDATDAMKMHVDLQAGLNPPPAEPTDFQPPLWQRKPRKQIVAEWTFYPSSIGGIFFLYWIARRRAFS